MSVYNLHGSAQYNGSTLSLAFHVDKDGVRLTTSTIGTADVRQLDGTLIGAFSTIATPNTYGIFKFVPITASLASNTLYAITISAVDDTTAVRSDVIYIPIF